MELDQNGKQKFLNYCSEKYEATKASSEKLKVSFLSGDWAVRKLISVWPQIRKEILEDFSVNVSLGRWCQLAMIPMSEINLNKCATLLELDLVLPDGRVHYWLEEALRKECSDE